MKKEMMEKIAGLCQKYAEEFAYELVDVEIDKEPTGKYLRIYIDKDGGITLDDCEQYHRKVQPFLEKVEYDFLEVSSPGIDRPLKKEEDFTKNLGKLVEIRFYKNTQGKKMLVATLTDFQKDAIAVEDQGEEKRFLLKEIALIKPFIDMEGIEEVNL